MKHKIECHPVLPLICARAGVLAQATQRGSRPLRLGRRAGVAARCSPSPPPFSDLLAQVRNSSLLIFVSLPTQRTTAESNPCPSEKYVHTGGRAGAHLEGQWPHNAKKIILDAALKALEGTFSPFLLTLPQFYLIFLLPFFLFSPLLLSFLL